MGILLIFSYIFFLNERRLV